MSKNSIAVNICLFILSAFSCVPLFADEVQGMKLDGTVRIYPKEFQAYDLLYVQVELQNKNNQPVMSWKSFQRDFSCFMTLFGESKEAYYKFPFNGWLDIVLPPKSSIEPGESFVALNTFLEFPEYITLQYGRSASYPDANKKFIEEYIGTGKTCTLQIALMQTMTWETTSYDSEQIEVKTRDEKEVKTIEAWHDKFENFLSVTSRFEESSPRGYKQWKQVPTVQDFEDFEQQLSEGTLKNYIHFRKLLASIPDSKDDAASIPDEPFLELKNHLDTLHPLERGVLTNDALKCFERPYYDRTPGGNNQKMKEILLPKLSELELQ